jgi:hypothetical protein
MCGILFLTSGPESCPHNPFLSKQSAFALTPSGFFLKLEDTELPVHSSMLQKNLPPRLGEEKQTELGYQAGNVQTTRSFSHLGTDSSRLRLLPICSRRGNHRACEPESEATME